MKLLYLLLLCLPCLIFAQDVSYSASYYGNNLWNPGMKAGIEKRMPAREKLFYTSELGFYWDPQSQVGIFHAYGIQYRKTGRNGWQFNTGISPISLYRSFLPETYALTPEGEIEQVSLAGRFYYAPTVHAGIGKQLDHPRIQAYFLNVHLMTLMPYNTYLLPLLNVEIGIRFSPKSETP